jgi:hypothetical protein
LTACHFVPALPPPPCARSWWYFKSNVTAVDDGRAVDAPTPLGGPKGALLLWEPMPELFPSGMSPTALGLPLFLHNRYFAVENNYTAMGYTFLYADGAKIALPIDREMFVHIMSKGKAWGGGALTYEQDVRMCGGSAGWAAGGAGDGLNPCLRLPPPYRRRPPPLPTAPRLSVQWLNDVVRKAGGWRGRPLGCLFTRGRFTLPSFAFLCRAAPSLPFAVARHPPADQGEPDGGARLAHGHVRRGAVAGR